MKFFKTNSFAILLAIFGVTLFLIYVFNKGEIFGTALAK